MPTKPTKNRKSNKQQAEQFSPFPQSRGNHQQRYIPNQRSKQNARWARHR